jgi:hypothetical protein
MIKYTQKKLNIRMQKKAAIMKTNNKWEHSHVFDTAPGDFRVLRALRGTDRDALQQVTTEGLPS